MTDAFEDTIMITEKFLAEAIAKQLGDDYIYTQGGREWMNINGLKIKSIKIQEMESSKASEEGKVIAIVLEAPHRKAVQKALEDRNLLARG